MTGMSVPEPITSLQNPQLKRLVRLRSRRERDAEGVWLIEGARELQRAQGAGVVLQQVFACQELFSPDAQAVYSGLELSGQLLTPLSRQAFEKVSGKATLTEKSGLKIEVDIDCTSLYSDDKKLTNHLKAPDFFAVKDHPKAKFVSTKVAKADKGYVVTGDLTLLGKKKEVSFPAEITTGDTLTIKGTFEIDRTDFGMAYGKGIVSNKVSIRVKVDAKK